MTAVKLHGISQSFGGQLVLSDLDLEILSGQYVVLLGPSGGGKTTLLRIVAGLQSPDRGSVILDDRSVDQVPPRDRGISMVFQQDGLYPHRTIRESLRFAVDSKSAGKLSSDEIETRITAAAALARVEPILDRYPAGLSGGELRRSAVAKAIVRRACVRLLDEPLSALDMPMRYQLQEDLLRWHREHPGTTIHVTHDGQEAMRMADNIAVLDNGSIVQFSSPNEIYSRPGNIKVAMAVGSPPINLIPCSVVGRNISSADDGISLAFDRNAEISGRDVTVGIRPATIRLDSGINPLANGEIAITANLIEIRRVERAIHIHLRGDKQDLWAVTQDSESIQIPSIGDSVCCTVRREDVHLFDSHSGQRIEIRRV